MRRFDKIFLLFDKNGYLDKKVKKC